MNRDKLLARLIEHEDLRLFAYDDATGKPLHSGDTLVGNPAIGIGRDLSTNGISRPEAFYLANNDIDRVIDDLNAQMPWWHDLDDTRQRALAEMRFNLGQRGLSRFVLFLEAVRRRDFSIAASEMLNSTWATQVGDRAIRLSNMMKSGFDP